jgi:hypothetical protein
MKRPVNFPSSGGSLVVPLSARYIWFFLPNMNKALPLLVLLLAATLGGAVAQSRPGSRKPVSRGKDKATTNAKGGVQAPTVYAPITTQGTEGDEKAPALVLVSKIKLKKPVLVYYEEAAPGKSVHQLIMSEANLGLLKTLDLETLMSRREIFVDGLGNRALPGSDVAKYRLLGTSAVAEATRRPVGDGRSFYSRLKVPASGVLYVVRESAEEYRHFVKGPQKKGALLDFTSNGLPGIDSVRAVYTLRKTEAAERGAGSGETIR